MDQLTLKPRKAVVEEEMESWDDDLDIGGDDFTFRHASIATTAASNHRDSISSRLSMRSDFDSNPGDEEKQVHVPGDDERSMNDAIATATRAGIPIPSNVPASALLGGTIKRLGGSKIKKIIQDDWNDDLEMPEEGGLKIKQQEPSSFPDSIRQVSGDSAHISPVRQLQAAPKFNMTPRDPKFGSPNLNLVRYRDEEDDDFFGDGGDTIKVSKSRQPRVLPTITPPTLREDYDDDFERDFQFPSTREPLRLSTRKEIPKTPVNVQDDLDEWGEGGSLGTRHGGKRDRNSNRSSSVSALSPSVASSLTIESEDEGLDGLVLPTGPLNFDDILKRRQQDRSPDHESSEKQAAKRAEVKEDFLSDLEIGDGDVFDSSKLTLNRNIKMKTTRLTSPARPKAAVSLTFTNKPTPTPPAAGSRLPRPLGGHDRTPSSLEPVSESGGPILKSSRRSQSRLGHFSQLSQSSIGSVTTPTTPSSSHGLPPSTPRRRDVGPKASITALRNDSTTTNSQLLKLKRSMPTLRSYPQSPAKAMIPRYERPSSRTDTGRPMSRPKTPVEKDRSGAESSMSYARRNHAPFLPAGSSNSQSQHVTLKTSRHFRRHDSESSNTSMEFRPSSRAVSRTTMRSPSPRRSARAAEVLARDAASKRQMTKPVRRRHFGDGCELDGFDDLPTSRDSEKQFTKEPIGRGPPKVLSLRDRRSHDTLPRSILPVPLTPQTPGRSRDDLPGFARDTTASRIAREQRRAPSAQGTPYTTLANQWKTKVAATTGLTAVHAIPSKPRKIRGLPQKPQLIKPLGNLNNPKCKSKLFSSLASIADKF